LSCLEYSPSFACQQFDHVEEVLLSLKENANAVICSAKRSDDSLKGEFLLQLADYIYGKVRSSSSYLKVIAISSVTIEENARDIPSILPFLSTNLPLTRKCVQMVSDCHTKYLMGPKNALSSSNSTSTSDSTITASLAQLVNETFTMILINSRLLRELVNKNFLSLSANNIVFDAFETEYNSQINDLFRSLQQLSSSQSSSQSQFPESMRIQITRIVNIPNTANRSSEGQDAFQGHVALFDRSDLTRSLAVEDELWRCIQLFRSEYRLYSVSAGLELDPNMNNGDFIKNSTKNSLFK
jgi:hypothetical protein